MTKSTEEAISKIPIVNLIARLLQKIKLPGLEGMSLYHLLEMYVIGLAKGAITTRGSSIAFSFFTAMFPFLIFILILIPYIPVEDFRSEFMVFLESFLPPNTSDFFFTNIFEDIEGTDRAGLLSSVFLLSIFLMANGVNAIFSGFENSYYLKINRSFVKQYLFALGIAILLALLVVVTVVVLGYFEIYVIENLEDYGYIEKEQGQFGIQLAKYLFFVLMIYLAISIMYYFGTREGRTHKFFSIGAAFTTFLIMLTSYLFGIYIENFSQYNELYGSIGALLILLLYIWLNSNILLLGFELNASLNQLKRNIR
ncbi:MAG: YihY/virulence factor BrkB family protein [Flavobacteriaceae bacterium]|nr:YihY/virulence factor BrkB family protein [Bacteroidia bacterium]NNL15546.1 YihY/virulence factor BrkB family protein [Flavobacteriaceae bacterium]